MMRTDETLARPHALVHGDVPLYRQIREHIRTAIGVGQLRPGDRLPSTRDLAAQFGAARGTVDAAYAILSGEGYLVSRGAAGTVVSAELDSHRLPGLGSKSSARPLMTVVVIRV